MLRKFDFIFKKEKIRLYESELLTKRIHYTITQIIQRESCKVKEKYTIKRDRVLFTRKKKKIVQNSLFITDSTLLKSTRGDTLSRFLYQE